jgi:DegV family protein with EDD domain
VTVAGRIGTFERSARLAASLAEERVPGLEIHILDSGSAAMGQGFVTLAAARAADRGTTLEGVIAEARRVSTTVQLVVALDTLRYLARTSRIPQVASIVSSVLDLKPIIRLIAGDVESVARVRSRSRSLDRLVHSVCDLSPPDKGLHLAVHHARAPGDAGWLLERLSARRRLAESYVTEFTPVMGAYCGPGLVGAAFYPVADGEAL